MTQAALIVACGTFDDDLIAGLKFTHSDACRIGETLWRHCGISAADTVLLHDRQEAPRLQPTYANVLRHVEIMKHQLQARRVDRLFLIFSGHGVVLPGTGNLHFLCKDTVSVAVEQTSVSIDRCVQELRFRLPAELIVILDTCRSTLAIQDKSGGNSRSFDPARLSGPATAIVYSCQMGQASYESDKHQSGVFTTGFIRSLSDDGQCVTLGDVRRYLETNLSEIAQAAGRPPQNASFSVENVDEDALVLVDRPIQAARLQSLIAKRERRRQGGRISEFVGHVPALCAVDFGTSKTVAAFYRPPRKAHLVPSQDGRVMVQSCVFVHEDLTYQVGRSAYDHYATDPGNYVQDIKRLIGADVTGTHIRGTHLSVKSCIAMVLSSAKRNLTSYFGKELSKVLISYPVNFSTQQLIDLKEAFRLSGFNVVRAISEAAAAAITLEANYTDRIDNEVMIIDLGGGTLDVAIVQIGDGVIEIKVTDGDEKLGGRDFDEIIRSMLNERIELMNKGRPESQLLPSVREFDRCTEELKSQFNTSPTATYVIRDVETVDGNVEDVVISLPFDEFVTRCRDLLDRIDRVLNRVQSRLEKKLEDPENLDRNAAVQIELVMLAGQGTRAKVVRDHLESYFRGKKFYDHFQENAVITRLALQAGILSGELKDILLLDVYRTNIGIYVTAVRARAGGKRARSGEMPIHADLDMGRPRDIFMPFMEDNNTIPTKKAVNLQVNPNGDSIVLIDVVEYDTRGQDFGENKITTIRVDLSNHRERIWSITSDVDANANLTLSLRPISAPEADSYVFRASDGSQSRAASTALRGPVEFLAIGQS
jgi:molecular chaperone DnaK (HSP70)